MFVHRPVFLRPDACLTVLPRRRLVRPLHRLRRVVYLISGRVGGRGTVHFFEVGFSGMIGDFGICLGPG